ncbi:tautomerase family protein [Eubacterium maltosivorans]|uniref:Uncharacterized protein n=1 Tax=Eubacterium maltosivorans TaxID=2041044 RepID=A0A4P9CAQ2_EUBML|nr:hypothetical protein [Eubacterium maltosivorans]QCT72654.1 hypothetical protein CPZ25_015395 [Eubacterium maltosivorans]
MPYIKISLSKKITCEEKQALAAEIAAVIPLLPDKPGDRAMVEIHDGCDLYRGGQPAGCAFMETRLYQETPKPFLKQYTEALFEVFERRLGYSKAQIYFNILELDHWGSKGTLR